MDHFNHIDFIFGDYLNKKKDEYSGTTFNTDHDTILINAVGKNLKLENLIFKYDIKIQIPHDAKIYICNCIFEKGLRFSPESEEDNSKIDIIIFKTIINKRCNILRVANYKKLKLIAVLLLH